jgi:hypothetical protein
MQTTTRRFALAMLLLAASGAFGLIGSRPGQAEPPNPCRAFALCDQ